MSQPFLLGVTPDQGTQNQAFPFILIQISDSHLSKSPCMFGQKTKLSNQEFLNTAYTEKNNSRSAIIFKRSHKSYHLDDIYKTHQRLRGHHKKELALFVTNTLLNLPKANVQLASSEQINEARALAHNLLRQTEESKAIDHLQWYQLNLGYNSFSKELKQHAERIHQNFDLA